jgi:hypothetical protein
MRLDEQGSRRSISDLQRFTQRRRLSQRDAKVAQPRARSWHDGALRRHGHVSSPPAASLTEMRQAPAPEEQGEFVADLDRIETQRSALPPDRAIHGGERTTAAEMPNWRPVVHGRGLARRDAKPAPSAIHRSEQSK